MIRPTMSHILFVTPRLRCARRGFSSEPIVSGGERGGQRVAVQDHEEGRGPGEQPRSACKRVPSPERRVLEFGGVGRDHGEQLVPRFAFGSDWRLVSPSFSHSVLVLIRYLARVFGVYRHSEPRGFDYGWRVQGAY